MDSFEVSSPKKTTIFDYGDGEVTKIETPLGVVKNPRFVQVSKVRASSRAKITGVQAMITLSKMPRGAKLSEIFWTLVDHADNSNGIVMSMTQLALATGILKNNLARYIASLEAEGFIKRHKVAGTYLFALNEDFVWQSSNSAHTYSVFKNANVCIDRTDITTRVMTKEQSKISSFPEPESRSSEQPSKKSNRHLGE